MVIYDSEEMKIESEQCKALKSTIDTLCTGENTAFYSVFKKVSTSTLKHAVVLVHSNMLRQ